MRRRGSHTASRPRRERRRRSRPHLAFAHVLSTLLDFSHGPGWACDDGVADTAENAGRCQMICNAVDECTGEDNSTDCRMECVDNSQNDEFEAKMEDCARCVEREDTCRENISDCADICAEVVTLSAS